MRFSRLCIPLVAALFQLSWSIPAVDQFYTVTQPDGSTIEVRNRGNEHSHFQETRDHQVVHRDGKGFFRTAPRDTTRHFQELDSLTPSPARAPSALAKTSTQSTAVTTKDITGSKNVLVVLVQFQDTKFFSDDPNGDITRILTEEGYNDNNNVGSIYDFFKDNSMGNFTPAFKVVGPITLSGNNYSKYGSYSSNGDYGAQVALGEALDTLKNRKEVSFKDFDNDGDGYVDFVHMIYAGFGSHDSDQDSAIWPHKWIFKSPKKLTSGMSSPIYIDDYACSSELDWRSYYFSQTKKYFGVGVFIHEFSHLLGLPDMYATVSDTTLHSPYAWDVMDIGAYNTTNTQGPIATSPPYYSTFERYTLNWMTPTNLTAGTKDTLYGIQNNAARWLRNPANTNEFFVLEYRDKTGWDQGLPNHGMLLWHIDYKKSVWDAATINNTSHQYVDVIEADGVADNTTLSADVFPGTGKVTSFNQFVTWDDGDLGVTLSSIHEGKSNNYVSFNVNAGDSVDLSAEDTVIEDSSATDTLAVDSTSADTSISDTTLVDSSSTADSSEIITLSKLSLEKPLVTLDGNRIFLSGLSSGDKTIRLFDLNGHRIFSFTTDDTEAQLQIPRQGTPFILCITRGKSVLFTKRIR